MRPMLPISFISFCLLAFHVQGQSAADSAATLDPDKVYEIVDVQPQPIGGMATFYQTIGQNIQYPHDARTKQITGKVFIQFVVERDGSIRRDQVKVARSVCKSIDEEAMRVVLLTSPWEPGTVDGKPVRALKTLPISFNLGGSAKRKN
jgi:protein TonB